MSDQVIRKERKRERDEVERESLFAPCMTYTKKKLQLQFSKSWEDMRHI